MVSHAIRARNALTSLVYQAGFAVRAARGHSADPVRYDLFFRKDSFGRTPRDLSSSGDSG